MQLQGAFSLLPPELFLNVLDQLVGTRDSQPVAYAPSNAITKALRALTLVSRNIYPIASRYLYTYCLYIDSCTNYARLRRTLGLNLGYHPQALNYGQVGRNEKLFAEADTLRYISSAFISPVKTNKDGLGSTLVRLPQIIDLFSIIGRTLKRLILDLQPVYAPASEVELVKPHINGNNIFLNMLNLEELVVSFDVIDYFPFPPFNLKRLAITVQEMKDAQLDFCFSISSLQTLIFLRPPELTSADIDLLFEAYKGKSLDVVLVDVNSNHRTPRGTRSWKLDDTVRIWEADVATSFYGDDDDLILCDSWIWTHGLEGSLWTQDRRRMASWAEIQKRLAGPVHMIMDGSHPL
ncbi:Nn.00g053750.m01.CDS01 [Neocucurbitaria sp. VM-36]